MDKIREDEKKKDERFVSLVVLCWAFNSRTKIKIEIENPTKIIYFFSPNGIV